MNNNCIFFDVCQTKEHCSVDCIRYAEMTYLLNHSGLPATLIKRNNLTPDSVDFDAFVYLADIKDEIVDFVTKGRNLYIYSTTTGNGKTTWLSKLLKSYFNQIWAGNGFRTRGYYIDLPSFFIDLKSSINNPNDDIEELKEFLKNVDLLCIDSISPMTLSEFEINHLMNIVDTRINNGLATIYGSNLDENGLLRFFGTRLKSRIFNSSEKIRFQGVDRRSQKWSTHKF